MIDVITSFLYIFLDVEIYIMQQIAFEDGRTRVSFLKKALYSLKQSLSVWYSTRSDFVWSLYFPKIELNYGRYSLNKQNHVYCCRCEWFDSLLFRYWLSNRWRHIEFSWLILNHTSRWCITSSSDRSRYWFSSNSH